MIFLFKERLSKLTQGRDNNFNLLRLVLASLVVLTHSFGLTGDGRDPLVRVTGLSLGSWAVFAFFVVSGYLICQSWHRSQSAMDYIVARILRIFPGLWLCVFICCFVLGPLVTSLSLSDYFTHIDFWKFFLENSTLLIKGVFTSLPGAFEGQGMGETNVSLWTLPYELKMYLLLLIIAVIGCFRASAVVSICVLSGIYYYCSGLDGADFPYIMLSGFIFFFFAGASMYLLRDFIAISDLLALPLIVLLAISFIYASNDNFILLLKLLSPYLVIYLAFRSCSPARWLNRFGDYSYGLYIYGFPAQQFVLWLAEGQQSWWLNLLLSWLLAMVCAVVSWHLLEARALSWRKRVVEVLTEVCKGFKVAMLKCR